MLLLTRKHNEGIILKDQITGTIMNIKITNISPGQVKIGFDAPAHINIYRSELEGKINKD